MNIVQHKELLSITCSLITLDGIKKIYTIKNDSIFYFNKKERITLNEIDIIRNYPEKISIKNNKYGCGVCVDGVDFKFQFQFKEHKTTYEIQSVRDTPKEVQSFFGFLLSKYNEVLE